MPEFGTITIEPRDDGSAVIADAALGGEAVIDLAHLDDAVSYLATLVPPADDMSFSEMSVRAHTAHLLGDDDPTDELELVDLDPRLEHHTTRPANGIPATIVDVTTGQPITLAALEARAQQAAQARHPSTLPAPTTDPVAQLWHLLAVAEEAGSNLLRAAAAVRQDLTDTPDGKDQEEPTFTLGGQLPGYAHGVAQ